MKRIVKIIILSALAASGLSCTSKQRASTVERQTIMRVKIERVTATPVDDFYEATGTVRSKITSVVSSKIVGSIISVHVHEGDRVPAGQTLIEIDSRDAAAQLQKAQGGAREAENALEEIDRNLQAARAAKAAAEASLELAASTYYRYKALLERRSVSPQEFDEVQAKYRVALAEAERATRMLSSLEARKNQALARIDQAKADVAGAQVFASYGRIASLINGVVTAKQAEVGAMASPGAPLVTIEDDSHYRLEVSVEESQIAKIQAGDRVAVRIHALGSEELPGTVAEIVPAVDPASRSHIVKIDLPARLGLRSGSYGIARFASGQRQAITIPLSAISERGQLVSVFVVDDTGTARLRLIKTGKTYGDRVEVLSGLTDGDHIVVDQVEAVGEGSRVESI